MTIQQGIGLGHLLSSTSGSASRRCGAGRTCHLPLELPRPPELQVYILVYTFNMRGLSITEFRRQCLALLENLPDEGVVITKRGRPLARVAPVRSPRRGERVSLPLLKGKGQPGPRCPDTETPYDLVLD